MFRLKHRAFACLALAMVLNVAVAGGASADNGKGLPPGGGQTVTGIAIGVMPANFDTGVTADYRNGKKKNLADFRTGKAPGDKRGGITPQFTPIQITKDSLWWSTGIHQKTSYYCLVAVIQTIAYRDISTRYFLVDGSRSLREAQDKIYQLVRDPVVLGADDWLGQAWVNRQYAAAGLPWRYDAVRPGSLADFMWYVKFDISAYQEGSYIRVDLSTFQYAWGQGLGYDRNGNAVYPEHATMAIKYNDAYNSIDSYDPFTYTGSNGQCVYYYNPNPDWACNWQITQNRYFAAMDRALDVAPFWY